MRTDAEIADLVAAFESCTLPLEQWHHVEHLTVSTWYLIRLPQVEATRRICGGIQRYPGKLTRSPFQRTTSIS